MEGVLEHIGVPHKRADGSTVVFERKPEIEGTAGETAWHEAHHVVVGEEENPGSVTGATIIPNAKEGYAGATFFTGRPSAAAAMAAHAHGYGGTSHDIAIAEQAGGKSAGASTAHRIAAGAQEKIRAIAIGLQKAGTLGGGTIRKILSDAESQPKLVMRIISPQGKTIERKPVSTVFQIPLELPKAA